MSESIDPLLAPPQLTPQAYMAHSSHGSIGPVIGVLAMITFFGAVAVIIGRLCSGRRVMGRVQYDIEGWVETKFAACIDGRVDPLPPPPRPVPHPLPQPQMEAEPPRSSSSSEEETPGESGREERGNGSDRPDNDPRAKV